MKRIFLNLSLALLALPALADGPPAAVVPAAAPAAYILPTDPTLPAKYAATAAEISAVPTHKHLKVAVYVGLGAGKTRGEAGDALAKDPNITVDEITGDAIRAGKLAGYDILVQPGGSGGGQAKGLGPDGRDKIREFVKGGGGFLGICGGSYLASDDYDWSLGIINTKVLDKEHWARGHGPVGVAPTTDGKTLLGAKGDDLTIIYWQGPIMAPKDDPKLPAYTELAKYTSEVHRTGIPGGVMPGATAVAAAPYGKGRVVCFGPHPEKTAGQEPLLQHAVLWLSEAANAPAADATVAAH